MHAYVDDLGVPQIGTDPPGWRLPVVLVHGLGVAAESMRKVAGELAIRGHRAYAPDLPGFGKSSKHKPPQTLDMRGLSEALEVWMDVAGIERAALLGNSLAAAIVADLAARRPERVGALIMLGPTTEPGVRSVRAQVWRWLRNSRVDQAAAGGMVPAYLAAGLGRVAETFRFSVDERIEDHLPKVRCPALVLAGSLDPITPLWWARRVRDLLPRGRIVVIEGAAHSMHGNQPEEVARHVHDFLEKVAEHELRAAS